MENEQSPLGSIGLAATTLYVSDLDAAVAWYGEALGLEPMSLGKDAERYASYLVGGAILVLEPLQAAIDAAAPGAESTTVNLVVDRDPAAVRAELLERGVRCSALVSSPHFSSFLVRDPDGNRFYVTRPATEEAAAQVVEITARTT